MKNFKTLLSRELRHQLKTFSFMAMILTALVVGLLVTKVQVTSFRDRWAVYREQQQQSQERLENMYFYSQIAVDVYMPPSPLSVFAKGLDESIGNKITVSVFDLPEPAVTSQRGNAFIKLFNSVDITGIVRILGIFIVLMAACPVAQEREEQTGKLVFANRVGRLEYYLSKYAALMAICGIITLITFAVPVVWMWLDPQVELSLTGIGSILLMALSGILYLSVFVLLSLAISATSSKIAIATLTSLMVWVMLAYVYPFTVNSVIDRLVKVPSDNSVTGQATEIDREASTKILVYSFENDLMVNRGWCGMSSNMGIITAYNLAEKAYFEKAKKMLDYALPVWFQRINRVEAVKNEQKRQLLRKKQLYDRFAFFIPDRVFQNVCEQSAGTDYGFRDKQFTEAAKNYRSILLDYIQSKNGFGYPFFTQIPEPEMLDRYEDYLPTVVERYCKNENLEKLNAADFPQFNMPQRSGGAMAWTGLLLMNLIFGGLSLWIYNKYVSFK